MAVNRQGTITHLFPGANTPQGFFSFYEYIAPVDANKIFVIKGGPGVGKSTFMRKIAEELVQDGYDVEFHHCSADNNSLDGVYIPAGDVALIDGTAPHVVDPKHPGAVDEILHLGDFWDEAAMRSPTNREAILRLTRACGFRFQRANDALLAAKAYLEEWKAYYSDCLDVGAVNAASEELIAELVPKRLEKRGSARRLFASAVTYDGPVHWLDSLFEKAPKRYVVKGEPGTGKATLLERLTDAALARGYSLDLFHCPMYPSKVDHLRIRETGVAVITSFWPHEFDPRQGDVIIDTSTFVDQHRLTGYMGEIEAAQAGFQAAVKREIHHLGIAKKTHDELERYYVPHMNFAAIEAKRVETLGRIRKLIAERG